MSLWLLVAPQNCADSWDQPLIFDPSFAENQPCMTPKTQWNSSLSIQCCLLDPYGRIKVVDSCLLYPCGCWWPSKLCWHSYDTSLIFDPSFAENQPCMTPKTQWNSSLSIQCCLLDPYGRIKVVDSCLLCPCGCWWPPKIVLTAGISHWFLTQVLLKTNPAWHKRPNITLPCPYNAICWIHMEE
jgi:hypothetical protein